MIIMTVIMIMTMTMIRMILIIMMMMLIADDTCNEDDEAKSCLDNPLRDGVVHDRELP